jgi:hypothetical protein
MSLGVYLSTEFESRVMHIFAESADIFANFQAPNLLCKGWREHGGWRNGLLPFYLELLLANMSRVLGVER